MIQWLIPNFIGNKNERELRRIRPTVARINEIEDTLRRDPPEKLGELTAAWKNHLARYHPLVVPPPHRLERLDDAALAGIASAAAARLDSLRGEFSQLPRQVEPTARSITGARDAFRQIEHRFAKSRARYLAGILPEAYAVVKNAARRLCGSEFPVDGHPRRWDMVHFDVQLAGGVALHRGMIAEMQTGEGKTLVATLPVYLNALTGLGVHVVTVNDYLAGRDSLWMGRLFKYLGLSVGCILSDMSPDERRAAYGCDITYGTNAEFGFDYLRDHGTATRREEQVQRGHYFAIIDEVDSILIDEARTPLIISGPSSREPNAMEEDRRSVEQLVKRQTALCNRLAGEVEDLLQSGDFREAGRTLLKLKLGQPRNRRFLRMMENPEVRRLLEKTELEHQQGALRKDIHRLKEQLFFVIDEKSHDADLMEDGRRFLAPDDPDRFTLPDIDAELAGISEDASLDTAGRTAAMASARARFDTRAARIHGISQLLKAWCLYKRDVHYVVRNDSIVIVDESTGREMPGRRWSDGLHQAVEIKERVTPENETRTYATITIQNYFRLYGKLAGMTGTASTAAAEFHDIYQLDVLSIPTNRPNRRTDDPDRVYRTRGEKFAAVTGCVREAHAAGQPVLVGTASVEASATLSRLLQRAGIAHTVLNAKNHSGEAEIIARAGERGAVTVSTNMAGRGTDIKLGDGVAELGGLMVIGTERHPSRRVDRQLRGRSARQGDPGRTRFFLSLEDDLLRNHASPDAMAAVVERADSGGNRRPADLGNLVEAAQSQVEQRDYKARKRVLDFDDVMNLQREILYGFRNDVLTSEDSHGMALDLIASISGDPAEYDRAVAGLPGELLDEMERHIILDAIDRGWRDHLEDMDELREGVYLRAQGQRDPLLEYKSNGYTLFQAMMDAVKRNAANGLFRNAGGMAAMLARANHTEPASGPVLPLARARRGR